METSRTGSRIREFRRSRGLRQSALAEMAGISASYLNLIEHNKRKVSGHVLAALAKSLGIEARDLTELTETVLATDLRDAATQYVAQGPEIDHLDEFVSRFPGWSRLVATQVRQMRDQDATVATLTDRLNFDPHLQETLHEMLTNITAIRSTSGIMVSEDDIPDAQKQSFQASIYDESMRLSEAAGELVTYLDRTEATPRGAATPQEAFEQFLESHDHVFVALEAAPDRAVVDQILDDAPQLQSEEARARARGRLEIYLEDARCMPLEDFLEEAMRSGFSPDHLARRFNVSVLAIFRRLSTLARKGIDAPKFGLVIINAAGHPLYRRTLPGFSLPRFTTICAQWPVFQALSVPGRPMENTLVMPDGSEFLARSIALPIIDAGFGEVPHYAAGMLVTDINDAIRFGMMDISGRQSAQAVGTSCRLCQRATCPTRAEPSLLPETH